MDINYIFDEDYSPRERRVLLKKEYIRKGLTLFGGNRKQTSKFLGISPRTLRDFMANNTELRDEFPANIYVEQKYNPQEKTDTADVKIQRKYKSLLKYQYKIKGKTFDTIQSIADYYNISQTLASIWIRNKVTCQNDVVRVISTPVNWDGSLANME